jgi:NitT/TauT family transport system permease protein
MKIIVNWLWPVLGFASLIIMWQGAVIAFNVQPFIAPSPLEVVKAIGSNRSVLLFNLLPTAVEALSGFVLGNLTAIVMATVFVHSTLLRHMYFPVAVIFNTIPIVALSPILILLFGLTITSKIIIAAIICLFPTLVNTIRGLESVTTSEVELMRILAASPREVFFKLRVPRSLPFVFSALRIASTTSVIGAIVSEWIGADRGIGVLLIQSTFNYRTDLLYASIATSSALALVMFGTVAALEKYFVRWRTA